MEQQNDEFSIDLLELFFVLRDRIIIIILTAVIFAAGAAAYTHYLVTPLYASSSSIYVLSSKNMMENYSDFMIGASLTSDYMQMIKSYTVLNNVITNLELEEELTVEELEDCTSVTNPTDTRMLIITAKYSDPRIAKEIVDELARVAIERMHKIMNIDKPNIYEYGQISENPVSPNMKKNMLIAGLIGMLAASAVFIVLYLKDDSICTPEDVEKYLNLNTLAAIPMEAGSAEQIRLDERKRIGKGRKKHKRSSRKEMGGGDSL